MNLLIKRIMIFSICVIQIVVYCRQKVVAELTGTHLTLPEVELLKKSSYTNYGNRYNAQEIAHAFMWHHYVPTIGLEIKEKINYPYIPHNFNLWQLAPSKGARVTVVIIDTGLGGYAIKNSYHKAHCNLIVKNTKLHENLNVTRSAELEALRRYCSQFFYDEHILELDDLISWIYEYCCEQKTTKLDLYLNKHINIIKAPKKSIPKIKDEITRGRRGIFPRNEPRFFTPVFLTYPRKQSVIYEFLPLPEKLWYEGNLCAAHGTHIAGIISAQKSNNHEGIQGYAPLCDVIMIKAFNAEGKTDDTTLCTALKKAKFYNPDIINLSLKINDEPSQELIDLLKTCKCVVMAAGNNTSLRWVETIESIIPVASYSYNNKKYPISLFCCYKSNKVIVAPGQMILSTAPSYKGHENEFLFMSGTSMACGVVSGLLALMLSEFKDDFTNDEIILVVNQVLLRMHNHEDWNNLKGTPDIRAALFIMHLCRVLKKTNHTVGRRFTFNELIAYIDKFLIAMPRKFATKYNIVHDFKKSFADFYEEAQKIDNQIIKNIEFKDLSSALSYCISLMGVD